MGSFVRSDGMVVVAGWICCAYMSSGWEGGRVGGFLGFRVVQGGAGGGGCVGVGGVCVGLSQEGWIGRVGSGIRGGGGGGIP